MTIALLGAVVSLFITAVAAQQTLVVVCADDSNDIVRLLTSQQQPFAIRVIGSIADAIGVVNAGDGVMILADDYPFGGTQVSSDQYQALALANLSGVYIEFPESLPGDPAVYTPGVAEYFHRVVMYSNAALAWDLRRLDLMQAQVCCVKCILIYPVPHHVSIPR